MKKTQLLAFIVASALWGNALYAATPIGPKADELTTVQGFQLSITAPDEKFQPDQAIILNSFIKNMTDKTQSLGHFPPIKRYRMEVTTDKGEPIPLTRYGQEQYHGREVPSGIEPCSIEAGESYENKLPLSRLYDLSVPGTYIVKVNFFLGLPPALRNRTDITITANDYVTIPSNTLRITILR